MHPCARPQRGLPRLVSIVAVATLVGMAAAALSNRIGALQGGRSAGAPEELVAATSSQRRGGLLQVSGAEARRVKVPGAGTVWVQ